MIRIDVLRNTIQQQDTLINQLRQADHNSRSEILSLKKMNAESISKCHMNDQILLENEQKLKLVEHSVDTIQKRNKELQDRCTELAHQMEAERKLRYVFML